MINEIVQKTMNEQERVLEKALNHFNVNTEDIPIRGKLVIDGHSRKFYIDGKLVVEYYTELDYENMKAVTTFKEYY